MTDDEKMEEVLKRLSANSAKWLEIREVLLSEIQSNTEIIALIDRRVKQNEDNTAKLN